MNSKPHIQLKLTFSIDLKISQFNSTTTQRPYTYQIKTTNTHRLDIKLMINKKFPHAAHEIYLKLAIENWSYDDFHSLHQHIIVLKTATNN